MRTWTWRRARTRGIGHEEAAPARRVSSASRRLGYLVAIVVSAGLLYVIRNRPGRQSLSFLPADTPARVLGWVNASLRAGVVANMTYLVVDARSWRALGELVTIGIGLGGVIQVWQVFPFSFAGAGIHWSLVFRFVCSSASRAAQSAWRLNSWRSCAEPPAQSDIAGAVPMPGRPHDASIVPGPSGRRRGCADEERHDHVAGVRPSACAR